MRRVFWTLEFFAAVLATLPIVLMPYRIALRAGEALGVLLSCLWRSRRKIAMENLSAAVSRNALSPGLSPEETVRRLFRNIGRSLVEVLKVYYGLGGKVLDRVEISGLENFEKARKKGVGVIVITGHCGNWELSALTFGFRVSKMHIVARPIDNPLFNRVIERARQKYGNTVIYKRGALKNIFSVLRGNGVVGILIDQSVTRNEGIVIDFLGKKAYTMKMPALIARKTGAPVLPAFISRTDGGHRIEIGEEIPLDPAPEAEVAALNDTVRFTGEVEEYVRRHPSEWLWIHRRWKRIKD